MQNGHEALSGFGGGGTDTDRVSDQPALDLSQLLQGALGKSCALHPCSEEETYEEERKTD